jgi:hypothetical protein
LSRFRWCIVRHRKRDDARAIDKAEDVHWVFAIFLADEVI